MSYTRHGKRSMAFPPAELERTAEFARLDPFTAKPCAACGSDNRVFNKDGKAFCRRCGRVDPSCRASGFTAFRPGATR